MTVLFNHKDESHKEEQLETEEQLEQRFKKILKQQNRRKRLKEILIVLLAILISYGGLKSLFTKAPSVRYERAINHYAFTQEYVKHYFHYPQSKEDGEYLQLFSLGSWQSEYDLNSIKDAKITSSDIYFVDEHGSQAMDFYLKIHMNIVKTDDNQEQQEMYAKVTVANLDNMFLVTDPIEMIQIHSEGMNEANKAMFEKEKSTSGEDCSDEEKKELENTVQLFLKTYMSDFDQAQLLMQDASNLKPLDPNTEMVVENFSGIRKTETEYIIDINMMLTTNQTVHQRRDYRFVIDQKTNKILEMEEY